MIVDVRQPEFVALIDQVDVRSGPTDAEISEIHAALDRYAVVVLRGQDISDAQQLAFCERFGSIERLTGGRRNRLGTPGLVDLANINEDDRIFERADERHLFSLANQLWHTDSSFKPAPARYSMLSCREATTSGGETVFADLRAAYEALSTERKAMLVDRARGAAAIRLSPHLAEGRLRALGQSLHDAPRPTLSDGSAPRRAPRVDGRHRFAADRQRRSNARRGVLARALAALIHHLGRGERRR